jgi:hypothetical protein
VVGRAPLDPIVDEWIVFAQRRITSNEFGQVPVACNRSEDRAKGIEFGRRGAQFDQRGLAVAERGVRLREQVILCSRAVSASNWTASRSRCRRAASRRSREKRSTASSTPVRRPHVCSSSS